METVGDNGEYANSGYWTNDNTIEAGPNNIFMTAGSNLWLASPLSNGSSGVLCVCGDNYLRVPQLLCWYGRGLPCSSS